MKEEKKEGERDWKGERSREMKMERWMEGHRVREREREREVAEVKKTLKQREIVARETKA